MSRYFTRPHVSRNSEAPRASDDDWNPLLPALTVDGEKQVDTGLVDAKGNSIVRLQEPIGFHRP